MINHIAIITGTFPAPGSPTHGTFVLQFARECARQGLQVSVIAPVTYHRARGGDGFPRDELDSEEGAPAIRVFRPRYLGVSAWEALSCLGRFSPTRITDLNFTAAARKAIRNLSPLPDALYGHFLYFGGVAAIRVGRELKRPAFPCAGEGVLWTVDRFGDRVAHADLKHATAMIANNSDLGKTVSQRLGYPREKIFCIPNGADTARFRPLDKLAARALFGLPAEKFIVGSVGNFKYEKGVHRVAQAIDGLKGVSGVFAGSGPFKPEADNIAFCDRVPHEDMPQFLSGCDLFVLPTLVEGSSNATVEAMACGLPIIGSKRTFNDDLLDDQMAIQVDPLDVDAIRGAIERLRADDALRKKMGRRAREKAQTLDISVRTRRILEFMNEMSQLGNDWA